MKFHYQAINEMGNKVSGDIEAESVNAAKEKIAALGRIPETVTKKKSDDGTSDTFLDSLNEKLTPVKPKELVLFTKQFQTMLRAGVSMVELLKILETQTENAKIRKTVITISNDIKEGSGLYDAFKKHPKVFGDLYCSMLRAGEVTGALPEVLDRLSYIIEHEDKIRSDIKSALRYPIIVSFFLGTAFLVLLLFVIPKFVDVFQSAGLVLPLPTKICIALYESINKYWHFIVGSIIILYVVIKNYIKTDNGKYVKDTIFLKLPLFGKLFVKAAMSRFSSIFSILQASGVGILDAMKILSDSIGNSAITREFDKISEQLAEGQGISAPLRTAKYFTPMVINMVSIGEETGSLDTMLKEVSTHYDIEVEYSMKALSDAIGPILTVGIAAVVCFFALAIYLPMWDLTKMAG